VKKVCVAAFILLLAMPAGAYEEDAHYYLAYCVARMAGLSDGESRIVASANQAVDEAPDTSPYEVRNVWRFRDVKMGVAAEVLRINKQLPRWHAMRTPGGDDAAVRARMAELYDKARAGKGDLVELGKFAHFMQDYYSHQTNGERFAAPFGHLFRGGPLDPTSSRQGDTLGHSMDWMGTDVRKAGDMARAWRSWVRTFIKDTGRTPGGVGNDQADRLIKLMLGKLLEARQLGLSHADTEKLLNDMFKAEGVDIAVAPYDERIGYAFDEDGNILKIDVSKDLPSLPLARDDASLRALEATLQEAAVSGRMPPPNPYGLFRTYRALEGARLGDALLAQVEAKLSQLRKRLADLRSQTEGVRTDLAAREKDVASAQDKFDKFKVGPCACGTATHGDCKSKKTCDPVCAQTGKDLHEALEAAKKRRDELSKGASAAEKAIAEVASEIKGWEKRRDGLPRLEEQSWLPEGLRGRLEAGVSTTRTLRAALREILPELPSEAVVTSGYRSPEYQLNLIGDLAQKHGVPWREDAVLEKPETWVEAWRALLERKGIIVNPPVRAQKSDGTWVNPSPHSRGNSMDISGARPEAVVKALRRAEAEGRVRFAQIRIEPANNCVHVQVE